MFRQRDWHAGVGAYFSLTPTVIHKKCFHSNTLELHNSSEPLKLLKENFIDFKIRLTIFSLNELQRNFGTK